MTAFVLVPREALEEAGRAILGLPLGDHPVSGPEWDAVALGFEIIKAALVAAPAMPTDPDWFSQVPAGCKIGEKELTLGHMAELLRNSGATVSVATAPTDAPGELVTDAMVEAALNAAPFETAEVRTFFLEELDPGEPEIIMRAALEAALSSLPRLEPAEAGDEPTKFEAWWNGDGAKWKHAEIDGYSMRKVLAWEGWLASAHIRTAPPATIARNAEVEDALADIARQHTSAEIAELDDDTDADWAVGYDACIARARGALRPEITSEHIAEAEKPGGPLRGSIRVDESTASAMERAQTLRERSWVLAAAAERLEQEAHDRALERGEHTGADGI